MAIIRHELWVRKGSSEAHSAAIERAHSMAAEKLLIQPDVYHAIDLYDLNIGKRLRIFSVNAVIDLDVPAVINLDFSAGCRAEYRAVLTSQPDWPGIAASVNDAVFSVNGECAQLNGVDVYAIVDKEAVVIGEYAAVSSDSRWKVYLRRAEVIALRRDDVLIVGNRRFFVDAPASDDDYELSAWLREAPEEDSSDDG